MSERLATTIALYATFIAAWAALSALTIRGRGPALMVALILLEAALVVQAVLSGAALLAGHHPAEPVTFGGYLAVSVAILPGVGARDAGRTAWDALIAAIACVALAVVCWRLIATWEAE